MRLRENIVGQESAILTVAASMSFVLQQCFDLIEFIYYWDNILSIATNLDIYGHQL